MCIHFQVSKLIVPFFSLLLRSQGLSIESFLQVLESLDVILKIQMANESYLLAISERYITMCACLRDKHFLRRTVIASRFTFEPVPHSD